MQAHRFFPFLLAVLLQIHTHRSYPMFQTPDINSNGHGLQPSEREQNGLRGTVRSVEEETTYPAQTLADGSQIAGMKAWSKTEYDRDGRIVAIRRQGSSRGGGYDGVEWVTHYIYSPAGLLLKMTFGKEGEPACETVNHYDDQGHLQSTTNSGSPGNPILFRYDSQGRKTRVAIVHPPEIPPGTGAVSMSIEAFFDHPERAPNLPEGGTAITLYDANDRPTEVQLHDPAGTIVSRTVRIYDDRGNIIEERQTLEDPLRILPATAQNNILSESGASAQDLREQLAQFLGAPAETYSCRYEYDKLGRKTHTIQTMFNHAEDRSETSYNDHGDVAKETSTNKTDEGDGLTERSQSEVIYSYVYDSMGNWTVRKSTSRTLPDGSASDSGEVRRTVEYY
jgi:YD repeat-containing protein